MSCWYYDFESSADMTDWINTSIPTKSSIEWQRDSNGTPSSYTGSKIDHTFGTNSGYYIFTETSSLGNTTYSSFITHTETFDGTNNAIEIDFWYNYVGDPNSILYLQASNNNGSTWNNILTIPAISHTGNNSVDNYTPWINSVVTLDDTIYNTSTVKIRFENSISTSTHVDSGNASSHTYSSWQSDAQLDDITITGTINVDTTPPIITLTGNNPQSIELGSGYTELGATTNDGSTVIIDSSAFTDAIGTYSIYYDSTDTSNNDAIQKVRTINVVDITPPLITLHGYNPQYIILGAEYTELGAITNDGSTVIIDSSAFTDSIGTYSIYYDSTDTSNNDAIQKVRTVIVYATADLTVGNLDIDSVNPFRINPISFDREDIEYENQDINNSVLITIEYPASFDLDCNIKNKFAHTNKNYTDITGVPISTYTKQATFSFTNFTNEIITIYCYDSITGKDSTYVIANNDFPMLQVFDSFRDGSFGTFGEIGELDFITLIVIIVSMIGFNRKNPIVGVMINVIVIGASAFLQIIQFETVMISAIATVVMFVIFAGRNKD